MECKQCGSLNVVRNGSSRNKQKYECKECRHQFLETKSYPRMKKEDRIIATALDMYFEGLSVRKVGRQLKQIFGIKVDPSTIWDWIQKYGKFVKEYVDTLQADLGGKLHADETMIASKGEGDPWFWEVIDKETRYLVASLVSKARTEEDAIALFKQAKDRSVFNPFAINVDGLWAYKKGYTKNFYNRYRDKRVGFIQKVGLAGQINNNSVERLHGTLKDRTKPMRALGINNPKRKHLIHTIHNVLAGWDVHYNFVRPHGALGGKTPAQAAGVEIELNDGWGDLIRLAIAHSVKPLPVGTALRNLISSNL